MIPSTRCIYYFQFFREPYFFDGLVKFSGDGSSSPLSVRLLTRASSTWSDLAVPILLRTPSVDGELPKDRTAGLLGSGAVYVILVYEQVA